MSVLSSDRKNSKLFLLFFSSIQYPTIADSMECSEFVCTSSSKKHGLPGRKNLYDRCYEMENLILHYQTIPIYYTIYLLCLLETLLYVVSEGSKGT